MSSAGRPPYFSDVDELEKKIDAYFESIKKEKEDATITGLALYLGFSSRQSFYDYENNEHFSYTIKRARLRIECEYEKGLHSKFPAGSIFALKNFGWADKLDVKSENVNVNVEPTAEEAQRIKDAILKSI